MGSLLHLLMHRLLLPVCQQLRLLLLQQRLPRQGPLLRVLQLLRLRRVSEVRLHNSLRGVELAGRLRAFAPAQLPPNLLHHRVLLRPLHQRQWPSSACTTLDFAWNSPNYAQPK